VDGHFFVEFGQWQFLVMESAKNGFESISSAYWLKRNIAFDDRAFGCSMVRDDETEIRASARGVTSFVIYCEHIIGFSHKGDVTY
jgi:hypothetical protein